MATSKHDPRRAEAGWSATTHDEFGNRIELKADADGLVWPKNAAQVKAADSFGLPVAKVSARKGPKATTEGDPASDAPDDTTAAETATKEAD